MLLSQHWCYANEQSLKIRYLLGRFAKVALQRLVETVQKGNEMYHGVVLDILKAIFEVYLCQFPSASAPVSTLL